MRFFAVILAVWAIALSGLVWAVSGPEKLFILYLAVMEHYFPIQILICIHVRLCLIFSLF